MRFDCANFGLVLNSFEEDIALDDLCRFRIRNDGMLGKVALPGTARFGKEAVGAALKCRGAANDPLRSFCMACGPFQSRVSFGGKLESS
jgi:hypothetical protein